jgi:hypothetical protein
LKAVAARPPDLIILNLNLPVLREQGTGNREQEHFQAFFEDPVPGSRFDPGSLDPYSLFPMPYSLFPVS